MTDAISAFGTLLKRGDGGTPEVFATIAEVLDIDGPGEELRTEEVTSHSSTAGVVEKVATLRDSGEVTFEINFDPAGTTHQELRSDMRSRTLRNWKLVYPDAGASEDSFSAYVTKLNPSSPVEGALKASVTLDISGPVS